MIRRLLVLAVVSIALGIGARFFARSAPSPRVAPSPRALRSVQVASIGGGHPRWRVVWTRPAADLQTFSLAADGSVAWRDAAGAIRRLDAATGKTLWQSASLPQVRALLAAPGGAVLAWSPRVPLNPALFLLDAATGASRPLALPASIWSVALTADGRAALVGTGAGSLVRLALDPRAPAGGASTWSLPGLPESLALSGDGRIGIVGTWLAQGAHLIGPEGAVRTLPSATDPARWFAVQISADGSTALALSARGVRGRPLALESSPTLFVWDARTGRPLWTYPIDGVDPRVGLCADGRRIALTYIRADGLSEGEGERKLTLFDRAGNPVVADKGSLFFSPELLAVSASGARITVRDDDRAVCTLDAAGRTIGRLALSPDPATGRPPTIRAAQATPDGAFLLMHRGDGQLTLLRAIGE